VCGRVAKGAGEDDKGLEMGALGRNGQGRGRRHEIQYEDVMRRSRYSFLIPFLQDLSLRLFQDSCFVIAAAILE